MGFSLEGQTHNAFTQRLKDYLVELGPENPVLRVALSLHGRRNGFRIHFEPGKVEIGRDHEKMVLPQKEITQVPIMMECFDEFFNTFEPATRGSNRVLDFSAPAFHYYRRSEVGFHFPCIPEDDSMKAYTAWHTPGPGDIVFDVGAHAGATSYFFSKMVGPGGKVYAFEPDENNYAFLLKNIEMHSLSNVTPVKQAIAGKTGEVLFSMDGTMSAGLADCVVYADKKSIRPVQARTLEDACAELNACPSYIKMDIEGAETEVIRQAGGFLKTHAIHFAIESYHRVQNEFTYKELDRLFPAIGYEAQSSKDYGQMFTWARPAPLNAVSVPRAEN
jgi:FkbM family methyltransferase